MSHEQLVKEADEMFDSLKKAERDRLSFRWSYIGNQELGDLISRIGRLETIIYSTIVAGVLGLIIIKALGG